MRQVIVLLRGKNILRIQNLRSNSNFASVGIDAQYKFSNHKKEQVVDSKNSSNDNDKTTEEIVLENNSTGPPPNNDSSIQYCVELVRKHDYENFLCALLLPGKQTRSAMFAIRAFNTELSLIRSQITQKEMGMGRMFFWRDALNQIYKKHKSNEYLPKHPVVIQLHKVVGVPGLSKKWLTSLLDCRERIMTDAPFATVDELEKYCDQSITPVLYLGLELLGVKNVDVDHAASHLGKAIGLSNFVRSLPYNSQRRIVLVPQDLLIKHKVSQENFIRNSETERIQDLVYEIASLAHTHYEKAKDLKKSVTKTAFPVFLHGLPSLIYLQRLQKRNFNPYDPALNKRYAYLPLKLYYKKFTKSYH